LENKRCREKDGGKWKEKETELVEYLRKDGILNINDNECRFDAKQECS